MKLSCPHCGHEDLPRLRWRGYRTADGREGRHLTAYCYACGRYLKHVPQTRAWLQAAEDDALLRALAWED